MGAWAAIRYNFHVAAPAGPFAWTASRLTVIENMSDLRQFRVVAYRLKEVEDAMRAEHLSAAADDLARAIRLFGPAPAADFLEESRTVLLNLLLVDRELSAQIMGDILDAIAVIDQSLRGMKDA